MASTGDKWRHKMLLSSDVTCALHPVALNKKLQYGLYLVSCDVLYFPRPNKRHIYATPLRSSIWCDCIIKSYMLWALYSYISVTAQLPGANGYTGGKVVFVDTENTLYPSIWTDVCMSQVATKPTKWSLHPVKTQISLGICSVWSVFTIQKKKVCVLLPIMIKCTVWLGRWAGWSEFLLGTQVITQVILLVLSCCSSIIIPVCSLLVLIF